MKLTDRLIKIMPAYSWIPLVTAFSWNMIVYSGSKIIAGDWHHYNIETQLDLAIPFLPWTILIYFGCYLFWIANYILSARQGQEEAWRFLSADFLAKCICLFFFLAFPTTNTRPEVVPEGFWGTLMHFLYTVDSADNLFPSIHCLTSWFCYIGVRGRKNIPVAYRIFSCAAAVAVFISTLTTKQHVLADVVAGVLLAELCYFIAGHTRLAYWYGCIFGRINNSLRFHPKGETAGEK